MPKRKILFVVDDEISYSRAPPSRFLYIARVLREKNFKAEIVGRKGEKINDLNVTQLSGTKYIARIRILLYAYAKVLVHSYNPIAIRGSLLAFFLFPLKIFRKKIFLDFHGWLFREIKLSYEKTVYNKLKIVFYYFVETISARHSNTILSVSDGVRELLGEAERAKSIVLENGVDITESKTAIHEAKKQKEEIFRKHSIPKSKPLLGFLGNWERHVDMETMFRGTKMAGVNMVVVGEGPNLRELKKRWEDVLFTGRLPRPEALKIIHFCDAVVIPYAEIYAYASYFSSRGVKDCLSLGKPIIMTKVRGREAYLLPNRNVLLYEPRNAEDLAEKIRKLLSDKKLQKTMKANNLKLSSRFDWKTLVEESGIIELTK